MVQIFSAQALQLIFVIKSLLTLILFAIERNFKENNTLPLKWFRKHSILIHITKKQLDALPTPDFLLIGHSSFMPTLINYCTEILLL